MPSGNFSGIEIFTRFVKIKDLPPPTLAGLFFCLASVEGAGLLFLPATIQPHTSVYSAFCAVHAELYTTSAAKQLTGLYRGFSCNLPCFAAVVWRVYPAISHRLRHAGAYHSTVAPPAHTRYKTPHRTLYGSAQPPYYNNVYKGAGVRFCYSSMPDGAAHHRPCQPGGVSSCRLWIAGKCCTRRRTCWHPARQSVRRAARNH